MDAPAGSVPSDPRAATALDELARQAAQRAARARGEHSRRCDLFRASAALPQPLLRRGRARSRRPRRPDRADPQHVQRFDDALDRRRPQRRFSGRAHGADPLGDRARGGVSHGVPLLAEPRVRGLRGLHSPGRDRRQRHGARPGRYGARAGGRPRRARRRRDATLRQRSAADDSVFRCAPPVEYARPVSRRPHAAPVRSGVARSSGRRACVPQPLPRQRASRRAQRGRSSSCPPGPSDVGRHRRHLSLGPRRGVPRARRPLPQPLAVRGRRARPRVARRGQPRDGRSAAPVAHDVRGSPYVHRGHSRDRRGPLRSRRASRDAPAREPRDGALAPAPPRGRSRDAAGDVDGGVGAGRREVRCDAGRADPLRRPDGPVDLLRRLDPIPANTPPTPPPNAPTSSPSPGASSPRWPLRTSPEGEPQRRREALSSRSTPKRSWVTHLHSR